MKKTIILSAIAMVFSLAQVNANSLPSHASDTSYEIKASSPFHLSIVKGDYETVVKLIDLGSDVNQKWNGMTPAMYAARYNRVEILQLLIDNGADLKKRCDKGKTAKYYAELSNATDAENLITETLSTKKRN